MPEGFASHLNADKSVVHRGQSGTAESLGIALQAKDLSLLSFSEEAMVLKAKYQNSPYQ